MALPTPYDLMANKNFIWNIENENATIKLILQELHKKYHNQQEKHNEVKIWLNYYSFTEKKIHEYFILSNDDLYILSNLGYEHRSFTTYYDKYECKVESGEGDLIYFETK